MLCLAKYTLQHLNEECIRVAATQQPQPANLLVEIVYKEAQATTQLLPSIVMVYVKLCGHTNLTA